MSVDKGNARKSLAADKKIRKDSTVDYNKDSRPTVIAKSRLRGTQKNMSSKDREAWVGSANIKAKEFQRSQAERNGVTSRPSSTLPKPPLSKGGSYAMNYFKKNSK